MTREMMVALSELNRSSLVSGRVSMAIATRRALDGVDAVAKAQMVALEHSAMSLVDVLAKVNKVS